MATLENACPKKKVADLINRQVTMKVCHQLKLLTLKILLDSLVTPVVTSGAFS